MLHRWTLFCSKLLQDKSLQRLLFAVVISLVLHLFLLGKFYLSLPNLDKANTHFLTAELVAEEPVKSVVTSATKMTEDVTKAPANEIAVEPESDNPTLKPALEPVPEASAVTTEPIVLPQPPPEPEIERPTRDSDANLGVDQNANPYKYVETEFDVRTDIDADVKSSPAGRAKMLYQLLPSAEYYQIDSLMEAKGVAALFISDLVQKSTGLMTDRGLRPNSFLYQYGDKADKTYVATFDWENAKLKMQTSKGEKQEPLEKGTQDLLSFMYQFMFIPPLNNMQLNITNGKKLSHYEYSFEGEAVIFSKMGDFKTIHIARSNADNDEKIELWLALDYQYVPVKIRKSEKNGKVYELLVTSLKTTKPDQQTNQQLNKSDNKSVDINN